MNIDEVHDFNKICKAWGYQPEEFVLSDHDNPMPLRAMTPSSRTVIVQRKSVKREYQGGHETAWLADFEGDLRNECFGKL
jgi:hypothetical protein